MLTWSNWRTEPRSNRYHYASRFAKHVPVFFVQPDTGSSVEESTELANVTLVHVGDTYDARQLDPVNAVLKKRGLSRPLIWIYNHHYTDLDAHFGDALRVYHATEDYFSLWRFLDEPPATTYATRQWRLTLQAGLIRFLRKVDAVVAVTAGVAERYRSAGGFSGSMLLVRNGCDYAFWSAHAASRRLGAGKIAIYQGGINERLDVSLMSTVMERLPQWEFRFCGAVSPQFRGWPLLEKHRNFHHLGELKPEALRDALNAADVGLIPFVQYPLFTQQSLPLKAFEYAACGLPVVSIPIRSLAGYPDVFAFARTPQEFAEAIERVAPSRNDTNAIALRLSAARTQDYDLRFAELSEYLSAVQKSKRRTGLRSIVREWLVSNRAERYRKRLAKLTAKQQAGS